MSLAPEITQLAPDMKLEADRQAEMHSRFADIRARISNANNLHLVSVDIGNDILSLTDEYLQPMFTGEQPVDQTALNDFLNNLTIVQEVAMGAPDSMTWIDITAAADERVYDFFDRFVSDTPGEELTAVARAFAEYAIQADQYEAEFYGDKRLASHAGMFLEVAAQHGSNVFDGEEFVDLYRYPSWRYGTARAVASEIITGFKTDEWPKPAIEKLDKIAGGYGFKPAEAKSIVSAWITYAPDQLEEVKDPEADFARSVMDNLAVMDKLVQHDETLPIKLHSIFGIRNFCRYYPTHLKRQMEQDFDPDSVAVSAVSDYNGALSEFGYEAEEIVVKQPVFIEAVSKVDLARRFIMLRNAGLIRKTIIVGAHGEATNMQLGAEIHQHVTSGDLDLRAFDRAAKKGLLLEGTEIILLSCNTGSENGISQKLAHTEGIYKVSAPDFVTNGVRLGRDGELEFIEEIKVDGRKVKIAHTARVFYNDKYKK